MSLPAISVIIPTRNEEKLLGNCLAQFTPEFRKRFAIEVIVSDGGSIDSTIVIARSSADHVITHEDVSYRQTIAEGRNQGASIATGEILLFLNADTLIPDIEHFFSLILARMKSDPNLQALAVKVQVIPEERIFSDTLFHSYFNQYIHFVNFLGMGIGRGECQIIRRTAFDAVKGYDKTLPAGEDFDLYKRIKSIGKIKYDGDLLVYESPRRYRKYGYVRVYSEWIRNGFSVLFRKKASSKVWEEVR